MTDDAIAAFVAHIDFDRNTCLALPDVNGGIRGVVQISPTSDGAAELAFSTAPALQRQGIATMLGRLAIEHLVTRGTREAIIYCALENVAMRTVAEKLGFTQHIEGAEIVGRLLLGPLLCESEVPTS
jgi:RimJ/RimL family protein N-acetyltransferase